MSAKATLGEVGTIGSHAEAVEHELLKQLASMDSPEFAARLAGLRARISAE